MENAWTREIEDIAREFNVDIRTGLTEPQFRLSLLKYGKNGKTLSYIVCHTGTALHFPIPRMLY
jgi:hypothetical protein